MCELRETWQSVERGSVRMTHGSAVPLLLLQLLLPLGVHVSAAPGYQRHPSSYCTAVTCHGERCTGNISFASRATLEQCQALCEASSCACFEWRDPAAHHPVPQQPCCLVTNLSTAVGASGYGYAAYVSEDRPPAPTLPPPPPPLYTVRGAIEVDTNENTMFLWHGQLYVLENMCVQPTERNNRLAFFAAV